MNGKNIFGKISAALSFGFYHPVMLMMPSKSIIGVNMLRIADEKPAVIKRCLDEVTRLAAAGIFSPAVGKIFKATDIAAAHDYLESRQSNGKIVAEW
jgi:NADPH:quinone reductase-like Zn-dependent oxidoreductase